MKHDSNIYAESQEEIAKELNITQRGVGWIEKQAMKKFKEKWIELHGEYKAKARWDKECSVS